MIKTKLFLNGYDYRIVPLDKRINDFIKNNEITDVIDVKFHTDPDIESALLIYKDNAND